MQKKATLNVYTFANVRTIAKALEKKERIDIPQINKHKSGASYRF